jgi:23S rRNA (cytosine1962-C5)-methyltransferase
VVIDPPSFAKRASEVSGALSAYRRLVKLGSQLVARNGVFVMASCSSRIQEEQFFELVSKVLQGSSRKFELQSSWGHDIDHPVTFPEGRYLKCGFYRAD